MKRERKPFDEAEVDFGTCVVWQVLGFGGRPNPLVYSRAASLAMRTGQALFRQSPKKSQTWLRGQLYVDDPAIVAKGPKGTVEQEFDVLLMWWLVLGLPLAWKKGATYFGQVPHQWIGVVFTPVSDAAVHMELPTAFLKEFVTLVRPFCKSQGMCRQRDAEKLVGRAGRIAYVVPAARPFVGGLYAALAAARRDHRGGQARCSGMVPARRFATAACWLKALVLGDERVPLPLRRVVTLREAQPDVSMWTAQFDASTTGGGAILRHGDTITEYFHLVWQESAS